MADRTSRRPRGTIERATSSKFEHKKTTPEWERSVPMTLQPNRCPCLTNAPACWKTPWAARAAGMRHRKPPSEARNLVKSSAFGAREDVPRCKTRLFQQAAWFVRRVERP